MNSSIEESNNALSISYLHLRKLIGYLGMSLPFVLWLGNYAINKIDLLNNSLFVDSAFSEHYTPGSNLKSSISHFYYSTTGELFTGTLIAVALFLFCYRGYKKQPGERGFSDNILTNIAAFAALGVVIFPTAGDGKIIDNLRIFQTSILCQYIHFFMASLFFTSKIILVTWNFRRTGNPKTFGTKKSHLLFLCCGLGMAFSLILIFIYALFLSTAFPVLQQFNVIYWLETLSLCCFGIAWLVKGKVDFMYLLKKMKIVPANVSVNQEN